LRLRGVRSAHRFRFIHGLSKIRPEMTVKLKGDIDHLASDTILLQRP
jgi:hypothetical protein